MKSLFRSTFAPFCFMLALLGLTAGCAHAPTPITLPTAAAVRAPIQRAQVSVKRAVALGQREQAIAATAVTKGIVAGSEEAKELSTLTFAHAAADAGAQDQLSAALYQTGELDRHMAEKQKQIDALAKHDKAEIAANDVLTLKLHRWEFVALAMIVGDYFLGSTIQEGLKAAVALAWRVGAAFVAHLAAFWPLLLALF